MGDTYPIVRAAAVQAAPVFLDREASVAKACDLIREAGRHDARLIAFPEGFVPAHPLWYHFHAATGSVATKLSMELFKNAVEVPGPQVDQLCAAAAEAHAYVVIGICEKLPNTLGTMFNTQLFIDPAGQLAAKRQKLTPTVGERLVHAPGQGDMLPVIQTEFGPASGLICGENANPLAIFALTAKHTRVHVMSWPSHGIPSAATGESPQVAGGLPEHVLGDARAFAQMSKAYVVAACGAVDERMIAMLGVNDENAALLRNPNFSGGSVIVAPTSRVIAGPLGSAEGILYANLDLELGIKASLARDYGGHYNRPDVFRFEVRRDAPTLFDGLADDVAIALDAKPEEPV